MTVISQNKSFDGIQTVYSHDSKIIKSNMRFAVYQPPENDSPLSCLFWLSGLTCTEQNFITKACAQRMAAQLGVLLIVPDTSPRGTGILNEKAHTYLGEGAGFYVDATQAPWSSYYQMYSYIVKELYELVLKEFSVDENRVGIFGHSMGGLGALNIALSNPQQYKTVSAFAPICAPFLSPTAVNAYTAYLGTDKQSWEAYDPISLIKNKGWGGKILISQGTHDEIINKTGPGILAEVCTHENVQLELRWQEGYDHSYYFVATFIEDHIRFHVKAMDELRKTP